MDILLCLGYHNNWDCIKRQVGMTPFNCLCCAFWWRCLIKEQRVSAVNNAPEQSSGLLAAAAEGVPQPRGAGTRKDKLAPIHLLLLLGLTSALWPIILHLQDVLCLFKALYSLEGLEMVFFCVFSSAAAPGLCPSSADTSEVTWCCSPSTSSWSWGPKLLLNVEMTAPYRNPGPSLSSPLGFGYSFEGTNPNIHFGSLHKLAEHDFLSI